MNRGSNADYGDEIVNARVKVWWPVDKAFYTGTVEAFDPLSKKHKVQSSENQEAGAPCAEERAKIEKKKAKRKASSSRKRLAPSSPKSEGRSPVQVENVPDEDDEEMPEFSFKRRKSRAGKKMSKK
ncbi:hypothetical protein ACP275_04G112500 [Erythranthe tilingii]